MLTNFIIAVLVLIVWLLFSVVYAFVLALGGRRRFSRVREAINNLILLPLTLVSFLLKRFG